MLILMQNHIISLFLKVHEPLKWAATITILLNIYLKCYNLLRKYSLLFYISLNNNNLINIYGLIWKYGVIYNIMYFSWDVKVHLYSAFMLCS